MRQIQTAATVTGPGASLSTGGLRPATDRSASSVSDDPKLKLLKSTTSNDGFDNGHNPVNASTKATTDNTAFSNADPEANTKRAFQAAIGLSLTAPEGFAQTVREVTQAIEEGQASQDLRSLVVRALKIPALRPHFLQDVVFLALLRAQALDLRDLPELLRFEPYAETFIREARGWVLLEKAFTSPKPQDAQHAVLCMEILCSFGFHHNVIQSPALRPLVNYATAHTKVPKPPQHGALRLIQELAPAIDFHDADARASLSSFALTDALTKLTELAMDSADLTVMSAILALVDQGIEPSRKCQENLCFLLNKPDLQPEVLRMFAHLLNGKDNDTRRSLKSTMTEFVIKSLSSPDAYTFGQGLLAASMLIVGDAKIVAAVEPHLHRLLKCAQDKKTDSRALACILALLREKPDDIPRRICELKGMAIFLDYLRFDAPNATKACLYMFRYEPALQEFIMLGGASVIYQLADNGKKGDYAYRCCKLVGQALMEVKKPKKARLE